MAGGGQPRYGTLELHVVMASARSIFVVHLCFAGPLRWRRTHHIAHDGHSNRHAGQAAWNDIKAFCQTLAAWLGKLRGVWILQLARLRSFHWHFV